MKFKWNKLKRKGNVNTKIVFHLRWCMEIGYLLCTLLKVSWVVSMHEGWCCCCYWGGHCKHYPCLDSAWGNMVQAHSKRRVVISVQWKQWKNHFLLPLFLYYIARKYMKTCFQVKCSWKYNKWSLGIECIKNIYH